MNQNQREQQTNIHVVGSYVAQLAEALQKIGEWAQRWVPLVIERGPELTRRTTAVLAKHGWYLSLEMPLSSLGGLLELLEKGDWAQIDGLMEDYYTNHLAYIQEDFRQTFPERYPIISSAIDAHRRGEYALSIPVFLAQADGICYQTINIQLFSKERKCLKPRTASYVEEMVVTDAFMAALLEPLRIPLPISDSTDKLPSTEDILNRHAILHGISTQYGTRSNSLKAISLLHYLRTVLSATSDDVA